MDSKSGSDDKASKSGSDDFDSLVERCLHDAAFLKKLEKDPGAALRQAGLWSQHREDVVKAQLPGTYQSLQAVAQAFSHRSFAN